DCLDISLATRGLAATTSMSELAKKKEGGIKLAAWQENVLTSSKQAHRPDLVRLLQRPQVDEESDLGLELRNEVGADWKLAFRADWLNDNMLKLGHHSTIFGFTSDLPPVYMPV